VIQITRTGAISKVPTHSEYKNLVKSIREGVVKFIHEWTRTRVLNLSEGAGGSPLPGYSTNPLTVDYPNKLPKRKTKPVGGTKTHGGMHFQGGYREYREKAGLVFNRFVFFNTGDAWRDWKVLTWGEVSEIGFDDPINAHVAALAEENRPLLFKIAASELESVDIMVIERINSTFFA